MKQIILLVFLSVISLNLSAQKIEYQESEMASEFEIEKLKTDAQLEIWYRDSIQISPAVQQRETGLWKITFTAYSGRDKNVETYLLKLDEGCIPDEKLSNLMIKGHKLTFVLVKE